MCALAQKPSGQSWCRRHPTPHESSPPGGGQLSKLHLPLDASEIRHDRAEKYPGLPFQVHFTPFCNQVESSFSKYRHADREQMSSFDTFSPCVVTAAPLRRNAKNPIAANARSEPTAIAKSLGFT
jgi:hypothetical protein